MLAHRPLHGNELANVGAFPLDLPFCFKFDSWTDLDLNFCGSTSTRPSSTAKVTLRRFILVTRACKEEIRIGIHVDTFVFRGRGIQE